MMDLNSVHDLKRLEEQIYQYKPSVKSNKKRKYISDRLRNQLILSKAVVKINRLDAECENLMISLKQRLMLLIPKTKNDSLQNKQEDLINRNEFGLNLSSESSEDETSTSLMSNQKDEGNLQYDSSEPIDSNFPLAFPRKSKKRLNYKSSSSASTSRLKSNHTRVQKHNEIASVEQVLLEREEVDIPTLHIKIPSLYRGNVHCIILDSLNFARKVFDYRANEAKQQQHQQKILHESAKQQEKQITCASAANLQQGARQEPDFELSQFIQDVMTDACTDETLQATSALESINSNLAGNYDLIENDMFINYSQSSKEYSNSQNSIEIADKVCNVIEGAKVRKKRKSTKIYNEQERFEPSKKKERKPRKKNDSNKPRVQPQPPTKSNLAQYVELFSNDCDILPPGSTTPAASSTRSQPLVSSTTHNFEIVDQLPQQEQQNASENHITYYIDGDWANGGPCQLVSTNGVSVDDTQLNQHNDVPVQNYVNYINSSDNTNNSIIATVLECNNSLPISIPQPTANLKLQSQIYQSAQQIDNQGIALNSLLPIINIQIPPLPNNVSSSEPPPAHVHKDVVDLSIKSKATTNVISAEAFNPIQRSANNFENVLLDEDECMPLDLSAKGGYSKEKISVTIDTQDEDFIRRLIEQNEFDYSTEELTKGAEDEDAIYDHENNKSMKEALDMPLLDIDDTELVHLVENTTDQQQNIFRDKIDYSFKNNEDLNFNAVSGVDSSLNFPDQSTTEIFNKLLDICPDNNFLNDINNHFIPNDNLNNSVGEQCIVDNSTTCEVRNTTIKKNQLHETEHTVNNNSQNNQEIQNSSNEEPSSSTSLAVQLNFSDDKISNELENSKLSEESPSNFKIHNEIFNKSENFLKKDDQKIISNVSDSITAPTNKAKNNENVFEPIVSKSLLAATKNSLDINDKVLSCSSNNHNAESLESEFNANADNYTNNMMQYKENYVNSEAGMDYSYVQPKENVVFSVAKVTLSEDYDPFSATNFSIGKSCELNELKKNMDNDKIFKKDKLSNNITAESQSFKDNSKNDKSDVNLCNNEAEIFQTVDQESADISSNVDCNKVLNAKNSNISDVKLSLLELESNIDCPLDFDEDLDDALSLATSCFDSPNDERFESSIVDINSTDTTNTLQDLQQHEEYSNPKTLQIEDSEHFETPKPSNSTSNTEKTIRTVNAVLLEEALLENGITIVENIILKVFGITCLRFLVDECNGISHCQLSHQLNDTDRVYRNLNTLDKSNANLAYKIVYNHSKLFKAYFNIFCTYYTNKNDRIKLLNMVNDCERYPEYAEYIISIYEGLVTCGLSRINACRLILKCVREKKIVTSIVEALVAIIMKSDWTMFTESIKKFTEDIYQFKFRICILEQMAPAVLNSKGSHLKQVFGKCFQTLHSDDTELLLNSPILIRCVALLTTNT